MYGSYGAFKRLGLSTTSHREPRMTQREWMSAYGTTNNLSRVSAAERQQRRGPLPATTAQRNSQPHRSDSQAATVAAMLRAANAARQAEAERARDRPADSASGRREQERKQDDDEDSDEADVQYSSDDDEAAVEESELRPESGIERQARADRRLQQLRKRHKADQEKQRHRREKTRRTRTLRRSQSDIQPAEEKEEGTEKEQERKGSGAAVSLPSLGGVNVEDVRERTRLLLREALVKTDRDACEESKASELARHKKLQQKHSSSNSTRKRKREDEDEEADEQQTDEDEQDQYTLLASDIEQSLYEQHSFSHSTAYRQHSRSLLFSLVNNAQLTPALLTLALSPQQLVTLPTAQLASADIAQLRAKEQQEATRDLVLAVGEGSRTSEYVCGGCGGRDTEWWLVKEGRDMRKAEVWGGGGDDGTTIILIRCCKCSREWRKEV